MKKYEDMSEWQLCQLMHNQFKCNGKFDVSFIDGLVIWKSKGDTFPVSEIKFTINEAKGHVENYLSPELIMPIAIKYGFNIETPDENLGGVGTITKYIPNNTDIQVDYEDKNETYRAIAICFLKMKDAENE